MPKLTFIHHGNFHIDGNEENAFPDRHTTTIDEQQGLVAFQQMQTVAQHLKQQLTTADAIYIDPTERCSLSAAMAFEVLSGVGTYAAFLQKYGGNNCFKNALPETCGELSSSVVAIEIIDNQPQNSIYFYNKSSLQLMFSDLTSAENNGLNSGVQRGEGVSIEHIKDIALSALDHAQVIESEYHVVKDAVPGVDMVMIDDLKTYSADQIRMLETKNKMDCKGALK